MRCIIHQSYRYTSRRLVSAARLNQPRSVLCSSMAGSSEQPWKLHYWPGIKGRGEYVRLVFEEAGVPYVEPCREKKGEEAFKACVDFIWGGGNPGFPARCPPAIERDGWVLCNTPAICGYLGRRYGLAPDSLEGQAHMDQILAIVTDAVAEGRLAFHPKDFYASHKTQVEESKPFIKQYGEARLPKYMAYFESLLARATPQADNQRYLLDDKITAADLSVYLYLAAAEQHYKQYYDAQEAPLCKAFVAQIAARPRIAAYLASDRVMPWDTDSMM